MRLSTSTAHCTNCRRLEGASQYYEGESGDDDDEAFCDPDSDPNVIRKVYELDGMAGGDEDQNDDEEEETSAGMALREDGFSSGRREYGHELEVLCLLIVPKSNAPTRW